MKFDKESLMGLIFVNSDAEVPKKEPEAISFPETTTAPTFPVESVPQTNTIAVNTVPVSCEPYMQKVMEMYEAGFDSLNQTGYDFYEYYKAVLKDVNIVEKDVIFQNDNMGQVIAILGRSGRGKSTLLKALAGLTHPKNGQVLIKNMQVETVNTAKIVEEGDVGFVDQKYTLFRHKTVDQILNYACRKNKMTTAQKKELIEKYLNDWGLVQHRKKYPCDLSGGQRQRVAIIEQMISSGHFIILDEPFSGLDVGNIREVKKSFDKIQKADSLNTIIFSTHDLNLAVELADSIYIVGFPDASQSHATIVKHFDLKQMRLAWNEQGEGHRQLVKEIDEAMMKS